MLVGIRRSGYLRPFRAFTPRILSGSAPSSLRLVANQPSPTPRESLQQLTCMWSLVRARERVPYTRLRFSAAEAARAARQRRAFTFALRLLRNAAESCDRIDPSLRVARCGAVQHSAARRGAARRGEAGICEEDRRRRSRQRVRRRKGQEGRRFSLETPRHERHARTLDSPQIARGLTATPFLLWAFPTSNYSLRKMGFRPFPDGLSRDENFPFKFES